MECNDEKVGILLVVVIAAIWMMLRSGPRSKVTLSNEVSSSGTQTSSVVDAEGSPSATTTPSPKVRTASLSPSDRQKLSILKEIFASKNDNDPRMDSELVRLSPELKTAMMQTYQALPVEKRNERGTIAFLIGREIKSNEDVQFLKSILMEKPCLSLSDCSKSASASSAEDAHLDGMNETTANYPQLMANRQMLNDYRKRIEQDPSNPQAAEILRNFREAVNSPNPRVAEEARRALQALGKSD